MGFKLYKIDLKTKQLQDVVEIDAPNNNPDDYSFSKHFIKTPPPEYDSSKYIPVWDTVNNIWNIKPLSYFEEHSIYAVWDEEKEAWVVSLDTAKTLKKQELDSMWAMFMEGGLETSLGIKVKIGPLDISMIEKGVEIAKEKGYLPFFRDYYGQLHRNLTLEQLSTIATEAIEYHEQLWIKKVLLQEKVDLATTVEEVENISWETEV
jgi:hypothetical protein